MKVNSMIAGLVAGAGFVILQSTLMQNIAVNGVVPDVALIIIVFTSNSNGAMKGQFLGFIVGLVQDFLSSGPLGFNALSRTVIGFIFGRLKGKFFLDSVLLPILFIVCATVFREVMSSAAAGLFLSDGGGFFNRAFLIELGLNAALSPIIFALMKFFGIYRINDKDGF